MSDDMATQVEAAEPEDTRDVVAREIDKLEASETPTEATQPEVKAEEQPEPVAPEQPQEAPQEQPTEPARNPFSAWKKEAQTALSQLPPETQAFIIEREKQFHKGIQQYKEDAIKGRSVYSAVEPHMGYLKELGVTPEQAFSKLIETEKALRTGDAQTKAQMLVRLAHDYGIDVGSLTSVPFDPYSYRMEQQLAQQQAMLEQLQQARQLAEQSQIEQTISNFAQEKPHFQELRETMADLLDKGFATDLDDAYEKAMRLEGLNMAAQQPQLDPVQRQNSAAKAAKAAAVSVKGSPVGVTRPPEPKTTEEAVRQAMAKLGL